MFILCRDVPVRSREVKSAAAKLRIAAAAAAPKPALQEPLAVGKKSLCLAHGKLLVPPL